MHNYSIDDLSKRVNIASKHLNIVHVNVAMIGIGRASFLPVFFIAKNSLEFFTEIASKNPEKSSIPQSERCTSPTSLCLSCVRLAVTCRCSPGYKPVFELFAAYSDVPL